MSDLKRVVALARLLKEQQDAYERLKEETAAAKEAMLRTEREDLPTLMAEVGLESMKLDDGSVVTIKEDYDVRITERTKDAALRWLLDNGFGGLIKTSVALEFGRGERDEASAVTEELKGRYPGVHLEEHVHHSTLKAFVREQLREGRPVPMDLFNVFPYSKATIK